MHKKIIYQGRLAFGKESSYQKIKKLFVHRAEHFYRNDILLDPEVIFHDDTLSLEIGREVINAMEKSWRNTLALLEYCAQFAVAGKIGAWLIDDRKLKKVVEITPSSDKAVVQEYILGLKLMKTKGQEQGAIAALDKAINKYDAHASAYEKRGYINLKLKKYTDASRDFAKCLKIDSAIPEAYYGLAKIDLINKNNKGAIENLELVTKKAIALQPIYWQARRLKAESHFKIKEYEQAAFDLKFLTARPFSSTDPNYTWKRYDYFLYGKVLWAMEDLKSALEALDRSLSFPEGKGSASLSDILYTKGVILKQIGKKEFLKNIKESAALGHKKAKKMLEGA